MTRKNDIVFLGVVHDDKGGALRLRYALEAEKPACITLETTAAYMTQTMNGENEAWQLERLAMWIRNGLREDVAGLIAEDIQAYDFMIKEAVAYAANKDVYVVPVENPEAFAAHVREARKEPTPDKIREMILRMNKYNRAEGAKRVDKFYEDFQKIYAGDRDLEEGICRVNQNMNSSYKQENTVASKNLLEQVKKESGKIVHICGLLNTLDDPESRTLYAILKTELQHRGQDVPYTLRRKTIRDYE